MADNDETNVPEEGAEAVTPGAEDTGGGAETTAFQDIGDDDGPIGEELLSQEAPPEIQRTAKDLDAVYDIPVQLSAVLGRANMQVSQLLKLGRGAVVELDRKVGEAIDIYVNNRLVARGEVVVVEERLGITMTEIIKSDRAA